MACFQVQVLSPYSRGLEWALSLARYTLNDLSGAMPLMDVGAPLDLPP